MQLMNFEKGWPPNVEPKWIERAVFCTVANFPKCKK